MTREDKDLLLKDLSARLPYGVKCLVNYTFCNETTDYEDVKATDVDTLIMINQQSESYFFDWLSEWFTADEFKPYLFPLSSMTEEQKNFFKWKLTTPKYDSFDEETLEDLLNKNLQVINYCDENHIDIRGLIPMGLAIDATGLNIY